MPKNIRAFELQPGDVVHDSATGAEITVVEAAGGDGGQVRFRVRHAGGGEATPHAFGRDQEVTVVRGPSAG